MTWSAADAGIEDLLKCGLRGSPTVVKRVFAPTPRAEKAKQIEARSRTRRETAEDLIDALFAAPSRRWRPTSNGSPPDCEETPMSDAPEPAPPRPAGRR